MAENTKLIFWPRSRDLLFRFCYPANISGTAADTNQKFSRATSKYHAFLNKQATEALELGKIRKSIALTSNTVTKYGLGLLTSWTKKAKINFKN